MFHNFFEKITRFFKKKEVEETKCKAWQEDCLGHKNIATNFSRITKEIKDQHYIISLEIDPGFGKTFFLQNWALELNRQNEVAVYYDAWNINTLEQPLAPLLSFMFDNLFTSKKIKKSIIRKFKNINDQLFSLDTLSKLVNKSPLGMFSIFVDVTKEAEKKESSEFSLSDLASYNAKKRNIEEFKIQLTEIIDKIRDGKNIYILVDNLELCRTKYIIDFFEHIKYTLSISGLIFILAINHNQSNVKKVISTFYVIQDLRRFIDLFLFFPRFSVEDFAIKQLENTALGKIKKEIESSFVFYSKGFSLSLKDIKHCICEINLLFSVYEWEKILLPTLFLFLVILKLMNYKLYELLDLEILSTEDALTVLDKDIKPMFILMIEKFQEEWQNLRNSLEKAFSLTNNKQSINDIKKMISYVVPITTNRNLSNAYEASFKSITH